MNDPTGRDLGTMIDLHRRDVLVLFDLARYGRAALDLARAILRRAERRTVELDGGIGVVSTDLLTFVNRASDAAYSMARAADVSDPELFAGRERAEPKA